jgi:gas vesicle protein
MSNERNYGILGFLAGAAIGAAIGVLLAPRSGKETRERMAGKAKDAKDEEAEDLKERLGKDVTESAEDVADRARRTADHVRHGAN